jgi:hypothetical protein
MRAGRWRKLGGCALALVGLGCGGQATSNGDEIPSTADDPGASVGGRPPSGLYRETLVIKSDSCTWSTLSAPPRTSLVFTSADLVNVPIGRSQLRQDLPWSGYSKHLANCDLELTLQVVAHDSTSLDIAGTETWFSTDKCNLIPAAVPQGPCMGEWLEHFDLEAACPATVRTATSIFSCE